MIEIRAVRADGGCVQPPRIIEGAEEFALGDGPTGALLVHGFTGSPQGLRGVGTHLAERGIAVVGVRLPGHGTTWEDLNTRTSVEWVEAVEHGYARVREGRDEVFLVGLSFGAALCLDLAARRPDDVAGLVCLATFLQTRDPRSHLGSILKPLLKSVPGVGNDIADPSGREIAYERFPVAAGASMLTFGRRVARRLGRVRCPVLVMHGSNDHTARPFNARLVHDSVSSDDKQLIWCERSYHVITLDHDRDLVAEKTYEFIKERRNAF